MLTSLKPSTTIIIVSESKHCNKCLTSIELGLLYKNKLLNLSVIKSDNTLKKWNDSILKRNKE
jgi:hypothetical protein